MIPDSYYENGYASFEQFLEQNQECVVLCPCDLDYLDVEDINERRSKDARRRNALREYIVSSLSQPYDYWEFGVRAGGMFRNWANSPGIGAAYGFDTFTGLPERWHRCYENPEGKTHWTIGPLGEYSVDGQIPEVPANATLVPGLFQDTLFDFLDQMGSRTNRRKIINIDSDIYSSALFVLTTMHQYMRRGDYIIFDEFIDRINEFRAFNDYIMSYRMKNRLRLWVYSFETFVFEIV